MSMRTSPLPYSRAKRLEPLLQRELSESMRKLLVHADLPNTFTLTKIEVKESLSVAKVFVRTANAERRKETLATLSENSGLLRRDLSARLHLRKMPRLDFVYDESLEEERYIDELLASIKPANNLEDNK